MLALGAAGLGATATATAAAAAATTAAPAEADVVVVAPTPPSLESGLQLDPGFAGDITSGGVLAPLLAAPGARASISAWPTRRNLLVGRSVSVSGTVRPGTPADVVVLQARSGPDWTTIARGRTTRTGRYDLSFRPGAPGSLSLRVRFAGDRVRRPALRPVGVVNVYRLAGASWYGAGGPLACGGTLTDSRLGVAHKTLPCGTLVRLHLGNRTVEVPVIDRGPYVAGRDYDLTPATKRALGFGDTGEIWATR
ncbi:MAG TPA: septal ring lytic transglycosylase RlpA family protein [Solirubrobacteraceae bacterium]|nr:septal ring lytic transglycosylase RlpA family protein [Solirubrobacteraceae bacterium]